MLQFVHSSLRPVAMALSKALSAIAWANVEKIEERGKAGQAWLVSCKHCLREFTGGTTRIVNHLLRTGGGVKPCDKCPEDARLGCQTQHTRNCMMTMRTM